MDMEQPEIIRKQQKYKAVTVTAIMTVIAVLHVIDVRRFLNDEMKILYSSFFSDIALSFGFYFLLCMNELKLPALRPWYVKAGFVFLAASIAEILQGLGIFFLGSTFDPLDFLMYAAGALLATLFERLFLIRLSFWKSKN